MITLLVEKSFLHKVCYLAIALVVYIHTNKQMLLRVCLRGSVYNIYDSENTLKEEAFVFMN